MFPKNYNVKLYLSIRVTLIDENFFECYQKTEIDADELYLLRDF